MYPYIIHPSLCSCSKLHQKVVFKERSMLFLAPSASTHPHMRRETYKDLPIIFRYWCYIHIPRLCGIIHDPNLYLYPQLYFHTVRMTKLTNIPSFHPKLIATSGSSSIVSSPPIPPANDEAEARPDHPRYAGTALLEDGVRGSR